MGKFDAHSVRQAREYITGKAGLHKTAIKLIADIFSAKDIAMGQQDLVAVEVNDMFVRQHRAAGDLFEGCIEHQVTIAANDETACYLFGRKQQAR